MQQIRHNIVRLAPLLPPCLMSANERERPGGGKESAANINQMMAAQIITHFRNAYQSQLLPEVATLIVGLNSSHLLRLAKSCDKNDKYMVLCVRQSRDAIQSAINR